MKCPHGQEVGDPPERGRCPLRGPLPGAPYPTADDCLCDVEMSVVIQTRPGERMDEQAAYVCTWLRNARESARADHFEQLKASRPIIKFPPTD
jgi:hypothetical protein